MAKSAIRGTYDIFFEVDGDKLGFNIASGEGDSLGYAAGLTSAIAPRVDNSAFTFSSVPPEVKVPVVFEDWSLGAGHDWSATNIPAGYNFSAYGRIDGSTPGKLTMVADREFYSSYNYTGPDEWVPVSFGRVKHTSQGTFLLAGNIYKFDISLRETGSPWVLVYTTPSTGMAASLRKDALPLDIVEFNSTVFVTLVDNYNSLGNGIRRGHQYVYTTDGGSTWTQSSVAAIANDEQLYFTIKGQTSGNPILYGIDYEGGLRTNATGIAVWSAAVQVGEPTETVTGLLEYNDTVYVFKTNGIYKLNAAGTGTEDVWIGAKNTTDNTNGSKPTLYKDGNIYCTYDGYLVQFDPRTNLLTQLFPIAATDVWSGKITSITTDGDWLYFSFEVDWSYGETYITGDYTYRDSRLTFVMKGDPSLGFHPINGEQWGPVRNIDATPAGSTNPTNPELHTILPVNRINHTVPIQDTTTIDNLWFTYLTLPKIGEDFDTDDGVQPLPVGKSAYVYGPWVDLGASNIDKYLASISAFALNASASSGWGLYLQYDYGAPDRVAGANGDYRNLDLISPYSDFFANLNQEVTSEANDAYTQYSALAHLQRWRSIRYVLAGVQQSNVNAGRPLLQSVALESAVLPKRVRSWSVQVEVSNDMQLRGGGKMKDGYLRQRNFLFEAPAKEITFYDRDGQTYLAKIQDIQSVGTRRGESSDYEVYSIQLTELAASTLTKPEFIWGSGTWSNGQRYSRN